MDTYDGIASKNEGDSTSNNNEKDETNSFYLMEPKQENGELTITFTRIPVSMINPDPCPPYPGWD